VSQSVCGQICIHMTVSYLLNLVDIKRDQCACPLPLGAKGERRKVGGSPTWGPQPGSTTMDLGTLARLNLPLVKKLLVGWG
jgi:hypothetical protein